MGIAERQARERKQRIKMILDAATQIIRDKGIEGATMEDIATAAELGKATIYNYFASKQLLLMGLDLRGTKIEEKGFLSAYKKGQTGLERTMKIVRFYFDYAVKNPVCFQAKLFVERTDADTLTQLKDEPIVVQYMGAIKRIHQILADGIADGIEDHTISADTNPQRTSLLLWCQSNGVIEMVQNRAESISAVLGFTARQVRDDFFRSVERQLAAARTATTGTKNRSKSKS